MKTNTSSHQTRGASAFRPDHITNSTAAPAASTSSPAPRPTLGGIDYAQRQANRQLATEQLIARLRSEAPRFFELAEVVGQWVWIHFTEKQPRDITRQLAQLGFHWNNQRQTWQHPCGHLTQGSPADPRAKYGSQFAADLQPA